MGPFVKSAISLVGFSLITAAGVKSADAKRRAPANTDNASWTHYAGNASSQKFSSLNLINRSNASKLKIAWTWDSIDNPIVASQKLHTAYYEATPIMVDGKLITSTSLNQVAALDPSTGKTLWVFDPKTYKNGQPPNLGFTHRGVAYWANGLQKRVLIGTNDGFLIALNAETGKQISNFGDQGRIDLRLGLRRAIEKEKFGVTSPPIVCRDTVIVGSSILDGFFKFNMPPGDVRGYDVVTGKLKWTFHTIPQNGEFGNETWKNDSWKYTGNANVWAPMSADEELGAVYLPVSTPSNDYYGGERKGDGLFGESLVSLNCETGIRNWHFQLVHHGLWDYDPPAPPILMDIVVDGKPIKAIAQPTKQAFVYTFDRVTGKPVWPINEMPVPRSETPGEEASPTQPIPSKPAAFDRQGITKDDFLEEFQAKALEALKPYKHGPLYTPPSPQGTVVLPGRIGGASWAGAAFSPVTGKLYVPSITEPSLLKLLSKSDLSFMEKMVLGDLDYNYIHDFHIPILFEWPDKIPMLKPPYGRITAIDMNSGDHAWMEPVGRGPRELLEKLGVKNLPESDLGWPRRTHLLVTPELLFAVQSGPAREAGTLGGGMFGNPPPNATKIEVQNDDPAFLILDAETGEKIAKIKIPQNAFAAPMTYAINGKQYIVLAVGGANLKAGLVALTVE